MHVSVEDRLVQLLGVTALAVLDRLRAAIADDVELGETEAGALVHLGAWPGTSVAELGDIVGRSQPAAVRLVDRLVERGLVRREPGADRRTVALVLSEAGSRTADAVLAARSEALAPLLAGLSSSERQALERELSGVASRLAADRASAVRTCRLCDRDACRAGPGCPLQSPTQSGGDRAPGPRS